MAKRMKPEEVFEYLDENWKWIAKSLAEKWYAYTQRPEKWGSWYAPGDGVCVLIPIAIDYDGPWEESLFERPKPDPWEEMDRVINADKQRAITNYPFTTDMNAIVSAWTKLKEAEGK